MIKSILAQLNGTDADERVLVECLNAARIFGGHIDALRIVPDPDVLRAQAAQVEIGMSSAMADMLAAFDDYHAERTHKARAHFETFRKRARIGEDGAVTAELRETVGEVAKLIAAESRFYDLTVLAGGPEQVGRLAAETLGTIVVASGRPVLLAPTSATESGFKTLAIAWKSMPESARAVSAALPLLERAHHVHVLAANEDDAGAVDCLDCSEAITAYLRRHNINANAHFVIPAGRSVPEAVIDQAQSLGAELLVTGGYGHSRTREFILGGFTKRVLEGVGLPVFMVH
jgi:nucleotide-binding universal stress UspA family protein